MKFRFSLFYFLFAFLGCSSSNGDIDKPENNGGAEEGNIEVSGDKVIVTPLSYDQAFRNPMMGWRDVIFCRSGPYSSQLSASIRICIQRIHSLGSHRKRKDRRCQKK